MLSRGNFMRMNHRWGIREPIECETIIYDRGAKPVRGQSQNVSFDGIFIAARKAALHLGTRVDLVVTRRAHGVTWTQQISAEVARLTEHGVGLMFALRDAGKIARFIALLRSGGSVLRVRRSDSYGSFGEHIGNHGMLFSTMSRQMAAIVGVVAVPDSVGDHNTATGGDYDNGKTG